jgi:CRISPR-associated protein Cmr1
MSGLQEAQKEILKDYVIAEIELNNTTPVRIGGYNARPYSSVLNLTEKVRSQNIKGLWRWWARAILAGAQLSAQGSPPSNISEINDEVSKLLGSTEENSHFFIHVDEERSSLISADKLQRISRIKLITMGLKGKEREEEQYFSQLSFKLSLGTRVLLTEQNKSVAMFALSSLLISLIFSGIGSMTTRGFGKLKINRLETKNQLLKGEIEDLNQILNELYAQTTEKDVTDKLKKMIWRSLNYASNYKFFGKKVRNVKVDQLPALSILLPDCEPQIFKIDTLCISDKDIYEILKIIGISTLKAGWKLKREQKSPIELQRPSMIKYLRIQGKDFHTWVLGLPRYQKKTGYFPDNLRRQSPIGFTLIRCLNKNYAIILYGFLTNEFAKLLKNYENLTLKHKGVYQTNVYDDILARGVTFPKTSESINPVMPTEVVYQRCFEAAWQFISEIVRECCK